MICFMKIKNAIEMPASVMAGYVNHGMLSRYDGHDQVHYGYDAYDASNRPIIGTDADSMTRSPPPAPRDDKINIFIIFIFILELLVLVFLSVLEYFLRATDVFPVRLLPVTCDSATPTLTLEAGNATYGGFTYNANVSELVILPLCFCVPPLIVFVSELALWGFTDEPQKMVRALCPQCRLPQVFRRIVRFIGTFIFGLLITMIFVDITKMFVGRPRPYFSAVCAADCSAEPPVCTETDSWALRQARLSFPSLHAAITAFSATFCAVYLHNVLRSPSVRLLRPFLALGFLLMAVMCSLARYGRAHSHWTDVAVGFGLGVVFALYMCISVLHHFRERITSHRLYQYIREFMSEQRAMELRELYKEVIAGPSPWLPRTSPWLPHRSPPSHHTNTSVTATATSWQHYRGASPAHSKH